MNNDLVKRLKNADETELSKIMIEAFLLLSDKVETLTRTITKLIDSQSDLIDAVDFNSDIFIEDEEEM